MLEQILIVPSWPWFLSDQNYPFCHGENTKPNMYLVFIFKHMQIVADMNMHTSLCVSEQTLLFFISNVALRCKRYCKWQCVVAFLWFLNFWSIGHKSIHISKCTNDLYVMSFIHEFLTSLIDSTLIGAFVSNKIYLWTTGTKKKCLPQGVHGH